MLGVECPSVDTPLRLIIGLPCHCGLHIRRGRVEVRVQPLMLFWGSVGCPCVVLLCQQLEDEPWCGQCLGCPHREHLMGVPVSGSRGNRGGLKLRAVGGGSINKWPCVLPGGRVTLRPLGAVGGLPVSWPPERTPPVPALGGGPGFFTGGSVVEASCVGSRTDCMRHGPPHRWLAGGRLRLLPYVGGFPELICWAHRAAAGRGRDGCPPAGGLAFGWALPSRGVGWCPLGRG